MGAYDRRLRIRGEPREEIDTEVYAAAVSTMLLALLRAEAAKRSEPQARAPDKEAS